MPAFAMEGKNVYLVLFFIAAFGCRKPYNPPAIASPHGYLVVEGVINSGSDSTYITLSRTVNVSTANVHNPELHAKVTVEGDQNISYPLTELGNGTYACSGLNLDNSHNYRLDITTSNGQRVLSNYEPVLNSPPIDSVSFDTKGTAQSPGMNVYVNTHDPNNQVKYYRWEYQETWIFHAQFASYFYSNGDTVLGRNLLTQNITDCWDSDTSSTILLGSSAKLSQAIINQQLLTSIVSSSEKVSDEYSILVKQYALSPGAYTFYLNLQKNTENLGSIFDAEPSEITGNLYCVTDPTEPVIGYISVGLITSQRIFISNKNLPAWKVTPIPAGCHLAFDQDSPCCYYVWPPGPPNQVDAYINYLISGIKDPLIPLNSIGMPGHPPIGYTATTRECADCTLRGSNKRPSFWQ